MTIWMRPAAIQASNWIEDKEEAQKKITAFEPPAFESADVMPQLKTVTLNFEKLVGVIFIYV